MGRTTAAALDLPEGPPPAERRPGSACAKRPVRTRPDHFLELACRAVGSARGGFGMLGPDGQLAEFVAFGFSEEETAALRRSPWPLEVVQLILRQPLPTRLPEDDKVTRWQGDKVTNRGGDGAAAAAPTPGQETAGSAVTLSPCHLVTLSGPFLGVPITGPGRCRGALYLLRGPGEPAFTAADEALVVPLSTWLEEGDLLEEARLIGQVRLLDQVAQAASGSLDLARVFQVALRELDRHLPLHVCAVWLLEEQESGVRSQESGVRSQGSGDECGKPSPGPLTLDPCPLTPDLVLAAASTAADALGLAPGRRLPLAEAPFAACLSGGQALYAELRPGGGAAGPEAALDRELAGRGANSSFVVPLRGGDRTVGVLQSVCTRPTGFTTDQIQVLYLAADLLGPAIGNCRLFARLRRAYEELRIAQNQLVQTEKMRALGELAGGMAHEFNNSLCGVLGFLELALCDQGLAPAGRGYLESARTCALDAAQTVRRVQDFARQRGGGAPEQVLDVNDLARQTVELTRHKWEGLTQARGTPVEVCLYGEATALVNGQAAELREVLTNLIFNAVDAMPQGGTLTIRTWSSGGDVFLAVQDTGLGIRDADRRRLFEPFFTTKEERGNGLGLSVTFAIVRRHGGDISVESQVGRGSTFTVRLPAAPQATEAAAEPPVVVPAPTGASLRVLAVEDEESIRRFLETGLTRLGHRPRLAADAGQALEALGEERFDVVLTDLGLPRVSGEEVARAAARLDPPTPVVLLTGWADQLRAEHIVIEGVSRILSKPVSIDTLRQALAEVAG
jgi:signal transduction histidine kinase